MPPGMVSIWCFSGVGELSRMASMPARAVTSSKVSSGAGVSAVASAASTAQVKMRRKWYGNALPAQIPAQLHVTSPHLDGTRLSERGIADGIAARREDRVIHEVQK